MSNLLLRVLILLVTAIYLPWLVLLYGVAAAIDLGAMRTLNPRKIRNYFLGTDGPCFELAPVNVLADLLSGGRPRMLPFENLSAACQAEIRKVTTGFDHQTFLDELGPKVEGHSKAMFFYKWYGRNIDEADPPSLFQRDYAFVKTIGVSVFNKRSSTGRHFGPLRLTHRVLFSLTPRRSEDIFIEVDGCKHYWHDEPLLIFDDTYIHRSVNDSDEHRVVMFIDIIRPTRFRVAHRLLEAGVWIVNRLSYRLREHFYGPWDFVSQPPVPKETQTLPG
jgi:beta-hydroxylase